MEITKYVIEAPIFTVIVNNDLYLVNEYTFRNLCLAKKNGEIQELKYKSVKGTSEVDFDGRLPEDPIDTTGRFGLKIISNILNEIL